MMLVAVLLFVYQTGNSNIETYPFADMESCEAVEEQFERSGWQDRYVWCSKTGFEMKAARP